MARVRQRFSKDRRHILDDFDRWLIEYGDPSNQELAELYIETRDQLFAEAEPGSVPIGFWAYEPSIPDDLRVVDLADREAIEAKRAAFLVLWRSE